MNSLLGRMLLGEVMPEEPARPATLDAPNPSLVWPSRFATEGITNGRQAQTQRPPGAADPSAPPYGGGRRAYPHSALHDG